MKPLITQTALAVFAAIISSNVVTAQLSDNFTDGDFTNNPAWTGNTGDWIVNASHELQSDNIAASSGFYVSTPSTLAVNSQWEFFTRLAFNTSGANYADVYLTASQSDLTLANTSGYFVRIGNTDDEVSLYRKDADGTSIKIIDGADGSIGASNNLVKIKVIRDAANQWTLYRDNTGTGANYFSEGTIKDNKYLTASYFGISVKQSTSSFFQKHFFDDIEINNYVPDILPPAISTVVATDAHTIEILFSEAVNKDSAEDINNYTINNTGKPSSVIVDASSPSLVRLSFATDFIGSINYTLNVNGIADLAGNTLHNGIATFTYFVATRFSIVISEIMADPSPQIGLPNAEWIELKNTSPAAINLQDYRIGKTGNISGPLPSFLLQPDSFVIVTTGAQSAALASFGSTISAASFPNLNNDADVLFLQTNTGSIMHVVDYNVDWYHNAVKAAGGWTLEIIDTHNPCAGNSNWKFSADSNGGSPGRKNSVDAVNVDDNAPRLIRAYASDSETLTLFFDEPLDSLSSSLPAVFNISDGIGTPKIVIPQGPLFNKVMLKLKSPVEAGKIYTVSVSGISDCSRNTISTDNTAKVGIASPAGSLDLVINEILFNPQPFGVDYLELYNRSNHIIDLSTISIANSNSTPVKITGDNYLLFPGDFIVLASEPVVVKEQYNTKNPNAFITINLPSFPDDNGSAIILNNQGEIIDQADYSNKWHFKLLDNEAGVSLERIDYNKASNEASNWTSAASTAGFGTPGYVNSQYRADLLPQGEITLNPKMFSPDNDGFEDFVLIGFKFPAPGYVANISIYDAAGRRVRILQRNSSTGASGSFKWDGLNDQLQLVPVGNYIISTDIFNLEGQRKQFKNTVVVAKKF